MDREILAAHLALVGGACIRSLGTTDYGLFIPGYKAWWATEKNPGMVSRSINDILSSTPHDSYWADRTIHPRDVEDPYYDTLVRAAKREGAL